MTTFFSFRCAGEGSVSSVLVLFCSQHRIIEPDLWGAIDQDVGINLRPDAICFIVRENRFADIRDQLSRLTATSTDWRIDPKTVPIMLIGFDGNGDLAKEENLSGVGSFSGQNIYSALLNTGISEIFIRRDGLLRPGNTVHYVHPSGRHSRGFMRAANVLISGPEVNFLAMCLLRHLKPETRYIWIDTSSIASIPYAMISLKQALQADFEPPVVNSFSSYGGLEATKFEGIEQSLVLISATTSGNLARKLFEKGFDNTKVVTLFSLATKKNDLTLLCDLSEDRRVNPSASYSASDEFTAETCPMCQEGSKPVRFVGDQFLADAIVYEPYVIVSKDAPSRLGDIMERFAGYSAFQVKAGGSDTGANEIWIDVTKLICVPNFITSFHSVLDRYAPHSTTTIIHLDDDASQQMGKIAADRLGSRLQQCPSLVSSAALSTLLTTEIGAGVIVVAACIGSGATLHAVSRDLRDPCGANPRVYLTGFSKYAQSERHNHLQSDLIFNGGKLKHEIVIMDQMTLPVLPKVSSWVKENALLTEMIEKINLQSIQCDQGTQKLIEERRDTLGELAAGNSSKLFWNSPDGHDLSLRQTFAFWTSFDYNDRNISQGDVFTTIASVLENLRSGPNPKLRQTNFHQSLLAPACFGRFNDGIIQASFLRSASPQELSYAGASLVSEDMARIMGSIIEGWATSKGEAAIEFLIALMTKRLTLSVDHLRSVLRVPNGCPEHLKFLIEYARALLLLPLPHVT